VVQAVPDPASVGLADLDSVCCHLGGSEDRFPFFLSFVLRR
jgi:hypothetical protein